MVHVGIFRVLFAKLLFIREQTIVRGRSAGQSSEFNLGCYAETLASLVEFVHFEP